ncbi:MAG TPA: hypothetical protein PLO89_06595 [Spirochaetota bacterium]|nr:hypothetical protein [Spirochaetota bacterium]
MEYFNYFLIFPEGDNQEISHSLRYGDIIDINGNVYSPSSLDPRKIAYEVTGIQKKTHFKETTIYYRVEKLNRNEVADEIFFSKLKKVFS